MLSFALASLATLALPAQGTGSTGSTGTVAACNNLSRTMQQPAGVTGSVSNTCPQITVSIGGTGISTPPSCLIAYTHYLESVYSCGPAATGIHCTARGYKATIKNYTGGSCPDVTGLINGMQWDSWDDIPANLLEIIQGLSSCVDPQESETFDWSASISDCATVSDGEVDDGNVGDDQTTVGYDNGVPPVVVAWTDPGDLFAAAPTYDPFTSPYREAEARGGGVSDDLLARVQAACAPLAGIELEGTVTVRHFDAGAELPQHVRHVGLEGVLTAAGTFDLIETSVARGEGEVAVVERRNTFDGRVLTSANLDAPSANAWGAEYAWAHNVWSVQVLPRLLPVRLWLDDPFQIPDFASHRYQQRAEGAFVRVQHLATVGETTFVDREYLVDVVSLPVPVVVQARTLDEEGRPCLVSTFGEFRQVAPGNWRPLEVEHALLLDRSPTGARVEKTYRFESASEMDGQLLGAVPAAEHAAGLRWLIWQ